MAEYRLIKGEFHLFYTKTRRIGSQPDGDSLWFRPHDKNLLNGLGGRSADFTAGGFAQLRFEGIDCLELHYHGAHQHFDLARAARDFTLTHIGFKTISFGGKEALTVSDAAPHPLAGYILTQAVDPHGRPIAFVYAGSTSKPDGAAVTLKPAGLKRTLNAQLVENGLAYPGYYTSLPADLRDELRQCSLQARRKRKGMWKQDASLKGATLRTLADLEQAALWPKLFRRLVDYFDTEPADLGGFVDWLLAEAGDRDDQLLICSRCEFVSLHEVIQVKTDRIKMRNDPHELIVVPR
jgi:endonuclease YncB( thermonuclease family)